MAEVEHGNRLRLVGAGGARSGEVLVPFRAWPEAILRDGVEFEAGEPGVWTAIEVQAATGEWVPFVYLGEPIATKAAGDTVRVRWW